MRGTDKAGRVRFLVQLVGGGMLFALAFQLAVGHWYGTDAAYGSFLFAPFDRFMDFYNVNYFSYDLDPYAKGTPYPPVALVMAHAFSRGFDYTAFGSVAARDSGSGAPGLLALTAGFVSILFLSLYRAVRTGRRWRDLASASALVACYPVLFLVDRGNYVMLAIVLLLGFASFYHSRRVLAVLCLALAISMKVYPVLFVVLLVFEKRFLETAAVLGLTVALSLAAFVFFKPPIAVGAAQFLLNIDSFSSRFQDVVRDSSWNTSFANLIRIPVAYLTGRYDGQWLFLNSILSLALGMALVYYLWREPAYSKRLLALTILVIGLQGNSPDYNLVYLLIPLTVYLKETRARTRLDYVLLAGIGLLLVPKGYYTLGTSGECVLTVQGLLNPLLLLILFGSLVATAPLPRLARLPNRLGWRLEPGETAVAREPVLT